MRGNAAQPHHREQHEGDRHDMPDHLIDQQQREIPQHPSIQLAFARHPGAEHIRQFLDPRRRGQGGDDIKQNFEANGRQATHRLIEHVTAEHEKPGHRVAHRHFQHHPRQPGGEVRHSRPGFVPLPQPATINMPAANRQIVLPAAQRRDHFRQQPFIMLQIAIHRRNQRRHAGLRAFHERARQTAPADTVQQPHIGMLACNRGNGRARAIAAVIIHKDNFPANPAQHRIHAGHQRCDVVALVQNRNNQAQLNGGHHGAHAPSISGTRAA